jgi:hypothetical protein
MNRSDPNAHYFTDPRRCRGEYHILPNAHAYMTIPLYSLSTGTEIVVKFTYSFKNRQRKVLCKYFGLITNR